MSTSTVPRNARVVNGKAAPTGSLLRDVRGWASFQPGVTTAVGTTRVSGPFLSPTAHVRVVAATVPVAVEGRVRAYVELELSTATLDWILSSDVESRVGLSVLTRAGIGVARQGAHVGPLTNLPHGGLTSLGPWRYASARSRSTRLVRRRRSTRPVGAGAGRAAHPGRRPRPGGCPTRPGHSLLPAFPRCGRR
jgi:hypothetical protein